MIRLQYVITLGLPWLLHRLILLVTFFSYLSTWIHIQEPVYDDVWKSQDNLLNL